MTDSGKKAAAGCSQTNPDEPETKRIKLNAIKISDRDITEIVQQLGRDNLQHLYHALDLTSVDIESASIKADSKDMHLRARRVLQTWRQKNGQHATREKVLCALDECELKDARENLEKKWMLKGATCQQFDLASCKQELITFYTQKMGSVQLLPWCDDTSRDMEEIYVSLELEEKRATGTSLLENNEELVTLTKSKQRPPATRVLVKGVAGSGKSTLLAKLAYSWAQQKNDSPLSNYELLFIIALREVGRDCSLVDAIFDQVLPEDTKMNKETLQTFIKGNPKKVVILLDGYDEYKKPMKKENGIDKILHFKVLRDCRVILATRPHKHLGEYQNDYISVNLIRFSAENIELYIKRYFQERIELVEMLKNRLKESDILTSLSTIPVILMLMCLLWEEKQNVPNTQSELYQEFVLYLWRKYCIKKGKHEQGGFGVECNKAVVELGQIAFHGLCSEENIRKEKVLFFEYDFTSSQSELGCEIGLLTRERLRSRQNMISSVTFLHKSFQEYCAAKYWADLFDTNPNLFHKNLMQINTWDLLLSKMELLKFCCGVVDKAGRIDILYHAIQLYKGNACVGSLDRQDNDENHMLPLLILLHESQITPEDDSANQQHDQASADSRHGAQQPLSLTLKSLFAKGELKVTSNPLQALPVFHNFIQSESKWSSLSTIKSLEFIRCPFASLDVITDTLQCVPDLQKVSIKIKIDSQSIYSDEVDHNIKLLGGQLSSLSKLRAILVNDQINYKVPLSFAPIVQALSLSLYCPNYTHIKLYSVAFNITHMEHLLSKTTPLKELVLQYNNITPSDVMLILDAIHSNLEHLSLVGNHVAEAIGHIARIMTPHLQTLDLRQTRLTDDHIVLLSQSIHKAINLEVLKLSENSVGMSMVPLAQQLQNCNKMSRLYLVYAGIPGKGIIELANRFASLSNLTYVDIRYNDVGNSGMHAVFKHLHHLTKLETLVISYEIDHQCSNLVRDCLSAVGLTVPKNGYIYGATWNHSEIQSLIKAASKHTDK